MADTVRELLPVGSVVRLTGADALVMVMGLEPNLGDVQADYLGVPCPMGLVSDDAALAFDADAVAEVVHRGLWDDQAEAAVAAVRRYRVAAADVERQIREFTESLTPEYVADWQMQRAFDQLDDEPEPDALDLFAAADDAGEPDLPDAGEPTFPDGDDADLPDEGEPDFPDEL